MRVSVVVPALDEEQALPATLAAVRDADEVIVVDGGSRDRTRAVAEAAGARVLAGARGRGPQLRLGAEAARGDWVVLLHADTRLGAGWRAAVEAAPPGCPAGAFRFALDAPGARFRLLERAVAFRCRAFQLPYGDQALFARREALDRVGGVPALPLMEDVALVRRLRALGPLFWPDVPAVTSARRWQRRGVVRTSARNLALLALYYAGIAPATLSRIYHGRGPVPPDGEGSS